MSRAADHPSLALYSHVLVPLDGSVFADRAVRPAKVLAARFGAELHTISIASAPAEAETLRDHAVEVVGASQPDRVTVVVADEPVAIIEGRKETLGSCLVCMSTHGRGRISGSLLGSVARSLLQRTQDPILAVGPLANQALWSNSEPPEPLSVPHIVACVDGSSASETVLPVAANWSKALGMRLTVLTVAEPAPPPVRTGSAWRRRFGPDADADQYITELAGNWTDAAMDVSGQVVYDPISPAEGVATYLDDVPSGLIALTTHARSGLNRLFAGANAASIVRSSVVPALVVPIAPSPEA